MSAITSLSAAIFLDRDGVIIHNRAHYVRCWDDVRLYSHALPVLTSLRDLPFKVVVVTNQAGIGKGYITQAAVDEMNHQIVARIEEAGGRVDGVFVCPHRTEEGCDCRKPQPGLLLRAAQALSIDLGRSYMIGDALTDIEAGQRAGVRTAILVQTGRGRKQAELAGAASLQPFLVRPSLKEAIKTILNQ